MITEHTHSENNDWQESVAEHLSVSETSARPPTVDSSDQKTEPKRLAQETLSTPAEDEPAAPAEKQPAQQEESHALPPSDEQESRPAPAEPLPGANTAASPGIAPTDSSVTATPQSPPVDETVRPFTDFIEEFRQTEERFSALLKNQGISFTTFAAGSETIQESATVLETAAEDHASPSDVEQKEQAPETQDETSTAASEETRSTTPAERPVSPLLRPATRMRLPRHGRHRVEEPAPPAASAEQTEEQSAPASSTEPPFEEIPAPVEATPTEEQPARPARRYRFDRPAATASASLATTKTPASPARGSETKEKRGASPSAQKESEDGSEQTQAQARSGAGSPVSEAPAQKTSSQETAPAASETAAPATSTTSERRRRGNNHDRQREKEQAAAVTTPPPELAAPATEPTQAPEAEIPVEDLPPLEYSELQAASSRRRRRRRSSAGAASTASAASASLNGALPSRNVPTESPTASTSPLAPPKSPAGPTIQPAYNIVSGYTVNQMNQGNDTTGPFMGPEPSPARGSTFDTPPSSLRHLRNEALRGAPGHVVKHAESPLISSAAVNHLANTIAQAIQVQSDRMVAELRRANQIPTNVSVSLPPFPSTERVGVFVDVANLLYSARTLRMTIDFGKLLDFLRGNRRLVRAQAYCPTSPQPGDDQMFLQAVKGLGYRITTKNYKTFSSGAKKADLDLDLCMDVVRLVDGKAVDCIVLVSGDSDFMPMLDYCSDHGVRVEVAAFDESMSATLRQSCDLFVNLSMLEEIRA